MIRYPLDYNPVIDYWNKIESGEIRVCKKIRKAYQKYVHDILHPGQWHYSAARTNHIIEFAENYCRLSKGKSGRQLVKLELWEKAHLAVVFGFIDDEGNRKYQRSILIVAKKNGKSLLASVVGLYLLCADGENGPEVYSVATKKDQAKIIWGESKKMVNKSPSLIQRIKPLVGELRCGFNEGTFKALASDGDTLDGLNVSGALMDEIHQWKSGKILYDIIADGVTARENPLIYITSTAGTVREDLYDYIYDEAAQIVDGYFEEDAFEDERTACFIYELDKKEEWTNEDAWIEANPGLGTIKKKTALREKVEKAKRQPSELRNLLTKEFNIPETSVESWLDAEEAKNAAVFDVAELAPRYGIGGADLSSTTDLTSAKMIFNVPGDEHIYVMQMYWIPEDLVEKRVKEDHVPYDKWIEKGYVRTCPGNKIDYREVTAWFKELEDKHNIYMYKCGYDAWSATYWINDMKEQFGPTVMEPVVQGKKTCSAPLKSMKADLGKNIIVYNNNPVDRWCLFNTAIDKDKNDNISLVKTSKPTRRIDGTASLMDAYVIRENNLEEYMSLI